MALKIQSITFVQASDVPQVVKNTEMAQLVTAIEKELDGKKIAKGKSLAMKISGAHKYTRYQLQKRLQKAGHEVNVREKDGTFYIFNPND